MKTMKKAQNGGKTYPLKGIENPTPGSINGQRGVPLSKNIQDGIKSGKLNKDGTTKNPFPKKKMGGTVKKAKDGGAFGMLSVKAGIDKNPNPTAADRIAGAKKMAKSGASMKKCKYGCK
jgi:hypothetical protein